MLKKYKIQQLFLKLAVHTPGGSPSPEHQAEMEAFLSHQVTSKPVRGGVGQEDDALGKPIAGSIDVRLLQRCLIWSVELGLVHIHETPLFPEAGDCANVVKSLSGNLKINNCLLEILIAD